MLFSDPEIVIQDAMHRACTLGHNGACQQKNSLHLYTKIKEDLFFESKI